MVRLRSRLMEWKLPGFDSDHKPAARLAPELA
jgi:hypothetical protein